jgi:flagellar biosynthetic protein FliP
MPKIKTYLGIPLPAGERDKGEGQTRMRSLSHPHPALSLKGEDKFGIGTGIYIPRVSTGAKRWTWPALIIGAAAMFWSAGASPADLSLPGVDIEIKGGPGKPQEIATAIQILIALTVLSLAPAILIVMTSFTRIIIVLAMLRHAFGMPETPPNTVLISLTLFLTLFTMLPAFTQANDMALKPYLEGKLPLKQAAERGLQPMREFMIRQTREQDLMLMIEVSKSEAPTAAEDIKTAHLIPAFMLSELKTAFQIGFVIFLPFLLLDIVVASILMSMGMLMVPPMMISLPLKVLMFVLIDGWSLVVKSVLGSFQ